MTKVKNRKKESNDYIGMKMVGASGALVLTIMLSAGILSGVSVSADETVDTLTVTVDSACTMTATGGNNGSFSATISPGTSSEIAGSTLTTVCNDAEGYSLYAIGYSGDSYDTPANTQMIGTNSSSINTGTTGPDSYWAMKLSSVTGITPPTILNSFDDYHTIPADYTQIAKFTSNTASSTAEGAAVNTNYKVNISSSQTAGTYTGKVKYVMVHPNTADAPTVPVSTPSMQDFSCSLLENIGDTTTLVDSRDGEEYLVGKLADGQCWMLDNLRLDPDALTQAQLYGTDNAPLTNASNTTLGFLKNGGGTTSDQYPTAKLNNTAWISGYQDYFSVPMTINTYKDTVAPVTYGSGSGKIGVYYNFCAASAGSYCYGNGASSAGTSFGNATEDLCPANWRMPTGKTGEYQTLSFDYSSDATNFKNALATPLSGYFRSGSADYQGSYGYFWSSTRYSHYGMWYLAMDSNSVAPASLLNRYYGVSMRCVFRGPQVENGMYMQDITQKQINNTPTDTTYTVKDKRDEESYVVAKLKDGKLWMLDNLRLDPDALTQAQLYGTDQAPLTNASNTTLGYLKNGGGTTSDQYPTAKLNNVAWTSDSQNYYSIPMTNNTYKDTVAPVAYGSGSGKIGVYYNFCAASAGSYCYGNGTSEGTSSGNATEDLCPANWRMPTGSSNGEYQALYTTYYSDANFRNTLSILFSGRFYSGSAINQGDDGYFWSSTRNTNNSMFRLWMTLRGVDTLYDDYRDYGFSMRCVKGS